MTNMQRLIGLAILFIFYSAPALATSLEELNDEITAFENSGQARFTPAAMKKVKAYQGASMLAAEQKSSSFSAGTDKETQSKALQNAIRQTLNVLNQAKDNAKIFMSTYHPLLTLETEATKAYIYHHKPRVLAEVAVSQLYDKAKVYMAKTIAATEQGQINQAKQAAKKAQTTYLLSIDAAMPSLIEETDRALSHASSVGAKRYAPRLWEIAETEFSLLESYNEDLSLKPIDRKNIKRPTKIGYAFEMAVYAQKMAIQAKSWSRNDGNYEMLTLKARQERLDLAQALGIPLDYEKVGIDIAPELLLNQIQSLVQERLKHEKEMSVLQKNFDQTLNNKLHEQRAKDQQAFQAKVSNIKSAFSSKLEQETFETKRQKKVHALFKKNEVDIIANLDGSLIIRAKKIKFSPNSSKVAGQYFEFLGRIKEALAMYPSRKVTIEGHTDSTGEEKENRKLSLKRAEAVQEFLIAAGYSGKLRALGFGEVKPIASNMYKKGRAMNRRIDIIIEAP